MNTQVERQLRESLKELELQLETITKFQDYASIYDVKQYIANVAKTAQSNREILKEIMQRYASRTLDNKYVDVRKVEIKYE